MKKQILRIVIAFIILFGGSRTANANFDTLFEKDGHQDTTFIVARFAGLDLDNAYILTYYSQYPDLDSRFNAIPVSAYYFFIPWRWQWRTDITSTLHSLHGGDRDAVHYRRESLAILVREKLGQSANEVHLQEAGLLIHALGDSFAHTKHDYGSSDEKAYGPWVGHLFAWHRPDTIANPQTFTKYCASVRALFAVLSPRDNLEGKRQMEAYLARLQTKIGDVQGMKEEIFRQCKAVGFSEVRFDKFLTPAFDLSKPQVQKVMDEINERCRQHFFAGGQLQNRFNSIRSLN